MHIVHRINAHLFTIFIDLRILINFFGNGEVFSKQRKVITSVGPMKFESMACESSQVINLYHTMKIMFLNSLAAQKLRYAYLDVDSTIKQ